MNETVGRGQRSLSRPKRQRCPDFENRDGCGSRFRGDSCGQSGSLSLVNLTANLDLFSNEGKKGVPPIPSKY
jgi:hypothetical protein